MSDMNLLDIFKEHLVSGEFVQSGDKVILAVSGGLDSVALLHLFYQIRDLFELQLFVVHVHHGIRGAEANRDLDFVHSLTVQYKLPFFSKKVEAVKYAADEKLSLEESARILRYTAFDEVLKKIQCTKLATAHTTDDQAETILDHFLRGSGILGMKGMSQKRGAYMRPLLAFSRTELEAYVKQNRLEYRTDSTNEELKYKRNRIRNELIPYLKKHFNQNFDNTLVRSGKIYEENETFLKAYANNAFKSLVSLQKKNEIILDIDGYLNYFEIIKKYIIFKACEILNIERNNLTFDKLDRILALIKQRKIGKKIQLDKNCEIIIDHDGIVITTTNNPFNKIELDLFTQKSLMYSEYEFRWSIIDNPQRLKFNKNRKIEFVDFDRIGNLVSFRTLLPGDKFVPLNFIGQKKVADYFSDNKIPHHLRKITPILEAPDGIIWICGQCIDDRFKITTKTTRLLQLEMLEHSNAA